MTARLCAVTDRLTFNNWHRTQVLRTDRSPHHRFAAVS